MKCGFIGLGVLGSKMAAKILDAGHALRVYDWDTKAVEKLVAAGAINARSVQEATSNIDALITCLPSPAACEEVMTGDGGALSSLAPGNCWIEMSTTDVDEMKRLALLAGEKSIDVLECPATGGVHRAAKGQMTLLDRCWWTTFAYQYFELLPVEQYETLCNMCLSEVSLDAALYLDVDPVTGLERAGKRGALDRIELSGASFFERARRGYLHLANKHADIATIIDSNRPYEQVTADVETWARNLAIKLKQKYSTDEM